MGQRDRTVATSVGGLIFLQHDDAWSVAGLCCGYANAAARVALNGTLRDMGINGTNLFFFLIFIAFAYDRLHSGWERINLGFTEEKHKERYLFFSPCLHCVGFVFCPR